VALTLILIALGHVVAFILGFILGALMGQRKSDSDD